MRRFRLFSPEAYVSLDLQGYRTGSMNETAREQGISHFYEHMFFKGTEKRGVGEIIFSANPAHNFIDFCVCFHTKIKGDRRPR